MPVEMMRSGVGREINERVALIWVRTIRRWIITSWYAGTRTVVTTCFSYTGSVLVGRVVKMLAALLGSKPVGVVRLLAAVGAELRVTVGARGSWVMPS